MKFNIILTQAEEGGYNVIVPELDGCFTEGDTEQEAMSNAAEAIQCFLEGLKKLNKNYVKPVQKVKEIEVAL